MRGNIKEIREEIETAPIDITYGGWGQDGHIAYNQARRHPFSHVTIDDVRNSTIRVQDNNLDTIIALAQRTFGSAYQFVPPMSVTLGSKGMFIRKEGEIVQRYRIMETDCIKGCTIWSVDYGIPHNTLSGTSGCTSDCHSGNCYTPYK